MTVSYDWLWRSTIKNTFYRGASGNETRVSECSWDTVYQAFKARNEAEAKKPECQHGHWGPPEPGLGARFIYYGLYKDKHCRDCGEKLEQLNHP